MSDIPLVESQSKKDLLNKLNNSVSEQRIFTDYPTIEAMDAAEREKIETSLKNQRKMPSLELIDPSTNKIVTDTKGGIKGAIIKYHIDKVILKVKGYASAVAVISGNVMEYVKNNVVGLFTALGNQISENKFNELFATITRGSTDLQNSLKSMEDYQKEKRDSVMKELDGQSKKFVEEFKDLSTLQSHNDLLHPQETYSYLFKYLIKDGNFSFEKYKSDIESKLKDWNSETHIKTALDNMDSIEKEQIYANTLKTLTDNTGKLKGLIQQIHIEFTSMVNNK